MPRPGIDRSFAAPRNPYAAATPSNLILGCGGTCVVFVHLLLLAATQSMILGQFRTRAVGALPDGVITAFRAYSARLLMINAAALVVAGVAALAALTPWRSRCDPWRIASLYLISWMPLVAWSLAVLAAFALGWSLDVLVISSSDATQAQIAETLTEALPVIVGPLTAGRHIANGAVVALFALLAHRRAGISAGRALTAAAGVGVVLTLAVLLT
jgi:hypothetical protein